MTLYEFWKLSIARAVLALMLIEPGAANSAMSVDAFLELDFNASGECQFIIDLLEPYSNLNSECNLFELDGETVVRQDNNENLSGGFSIGDPPRTQDVFTWLTLLTGAHPGENFCQEMGSEDPTYANCPAEISPPISVVVGHVSGPNENIDRCGAKDCDTVPPLAFPEYDVWYESETCFGLPNERLSGFGVLSQESPNYSKQVDPSTGSSAGSICIYTQYVPPLQW